MHGLILLGVSAVAGSALGALSALPGAYRGIPAHTPTAIVLPCQEDETPRTYWASSHWELRCIHADTIR